MALLESRNPGIVPLIPFAGGTSPELVERAFGVLEAEKPDVQMALAFFSEWVFPGRDWAAMIPREIQMKSSIFKELRKELRAEAELEVRLEGRREGRVELLSNLLEVRLEKSRKLDSILKRLPLCSDSTFEKIGVLIVEGKSDKDLLAELDRLVPKRTRRK